MTQIIKNCDVETLSRIKPTCTPTPTATPTATPSVTPSVSPTATVLVSPTPTVTKLPTVGTSFDWLFWMAGIVIVAVVAWAVIKKA